MSRYRYVWSICTIASIGGLLFGYDWVVIGGAKPFYEAYFGISEDLHAWVAGWAMSSAILGCLVGASSAVFLSDRLGRKPVLIMAATLFLVSAIWTALASSLSVFVMARIVGGLGIGLASGTSPLYIAEVSPKAVRGRLVSMNQLAIVLGILLAQGINLGIYSLAPLAENASLVERVSSWNGQTGWRWMFGAEAIPASLFLGFAFFIPESPRWLLRHGDLVGSMEVLNRIGGQQFADATVLAVEERLREDPYESLPTPAARRYRLLWIGLFLAIFQQWCGINVIFNYAEEILVDAGYSLSDVMLEIVLTGAVNLLFTIVAIQTVDRIGRRPLMLLGSAGLFVCFAWLGTSYYLGIKGGIVLMSLLTAVSIYAMTLAPITWVLLSELFPIRRRGTWISICVAALWAACFALTISFKPLNSFLGAASTFWLYASVCLVGTALVYHFVPETKGKTLEMIESELRA